ncbi:hypothetical protein F383_17519 [Gossypium arboreum]|uniref:Uncharacterized protein n=1 Tax=Gossypium arboreum TaxID=29729 RepID=A0A0B0NNL7_GOSAR|nr:hypothetical protein F383_17519 [Gossypium arboreum]
MATLQRTVVRRSDPGDVETNRQKFFYTRLTFR